MLLGLVMVWFTVRTWLKLNQQKIKFIFLNQTCQQTFKSVWTNFDIKWTGSIHSKLNLVKICLTNTKLESHFLPSTLLNLVHSICKHILCAFSTANTGSSTVVASLSDNTDTHDDKTTTARTCFKSLTP